MSDSHEPPLSEIRARWASFLGALVAMVFLAFWIILELSNMEKEATFCAICSVFTGISSLLYTLIAFLLKRKPGTENEREAAGNHAMSEVRIKVTESGEITLEDHAVSLEQLSTKLADLKKSGGVVWYYRANPQCEPHPITKKVIELVIQNSLPIRFFTNPDFSD
jgi:hypothetical protein